MAGLNKVCLIGHLGADPEIRSLNSGDRVCNLRLATSETWKDKNSGERKEKVEWHRIVIFNDGLVKVAENYLRKGSKVYIEGQIQTRKWTDQGGVEKFSTEIVLQKFRGEIVMLDSKKDDGGGNQSRHERPAEGGGGSGYSTEGGFDEEDHIPFVTCYSIR